MFYKDLILAIRHLRKRKLYTVVIVASLAIGFACTSLLVSFLIAEIKTDSFHSNQERSFQLFSNDPFGGKGSISFIPDFSDYFTSTYPEIESTCRIGNIDKASLETEAGEFNDIMVLGSDTSFFTFFDFPGVEGLVKRSINPESIILSAEKVKVLFGEGMIVGKSVTVKTPDSIRTLIVSAVISKGKGNSHLKFDAIIHHDAFNDKNQGGATYMLLKDASQAESFVRKLNEDPHRPGLLGEGTMQYTLNPLTASYFNADNRMPYMKTRSMMFIWVSGVVGGLIFFMASFNFINLFLLSLQGRRKDVGIKKTLGVSLQSLFKASVAEVIMYVASGFVLSVLLVSLFLSSFNRVLNTSVDLQHLLRKEVVFVMAILTIVLGIVAVIISTGRQWRMRPVSLMKNTSSRVTFSQTFFMVQFVISVTLMISAVTIIRQMNFLEQEPLGFNRNMIQLQSPGKEISASLPVLKQQLMQISGINHVTVCSGNPISGNAIVRYDLEDGKFYTPYLFSGDADFVKTVNLTLLAGELPSTVGNRKLVNETLVKFFDLQQPVGEKIPGTEDIIVGVVKDFTCVSFKEKIPPVIISYDENVSRMLIDYNDHDIASLMPAIQKLWNKVFPDYAFSYQVIQQDLLNKYKAERFFYTIIVTSSIVSMIISCFGLFALSWAVVQARVKEVGIRKVFGATTKDILRLLTLSFVKRVVVAFLIAVPVAYFLMERWLDVFVNKIRLDVSLFFVSGSMVLVIAVVTIGFQTIRASLLNPVDELRSE